jgi:hypothetical protein
VSLRSLLKGFFSIIALAMLGLVGWDAVRTAGAQGGGFPVNPTFQSVGIFTPATPGSVALNVTGIANNDTVVVNGSSTSGQSDGLDIFSGTTSADYSACFRNQAGTVVIFCIRGDGGITASNPSGGDEGSGTLNVAGGYYVNGVKTPRISYGEIDISAATTCNIITPSGTAGQSSNLASCVASGGVATVTFTTSYTTNAPSCTASSNITGSFGFVQGSTPTTVSVEVGAGLTPNDVYVICMGT